MTRSIWRSTGVVLLASSAWAASAQTGNASIVVRDADTGQLRAPTSDEARAIRASRGPAAAAMSGSRGVVSGSTTPLMWQLPNGATIAETTEDMMSASVAVRGKDGKLVRQCAGSLALANRIAQGQRVAFAKNLLERHDAVK